MTIYVVGIGPGDHSLLTKAALEALQQADVVVGYQTYIDLISDLISDKPIIATGMTGETERVKQAIAAARNSQTVAIVSSGDAGIYGMAGLVYELAAPWPELKIGVIPGVTAAASAAAVLGAPLMNDFATISLSDRLTPWSVIEQRLVAAAQGDFVIALYNPASMGRPEHLANACRLLLNYRSGQTVCGLVRNIGRPGCSSELCNLAELAAKPVDMFTTVIIGNSQTVVLNQKMVTRRGYI